MYNFDLVELLFNYLSHLQACCVLWATLGFKKAAKACFNYPALVLTPCFGTWTFCPAARNNESTSNSNCCMSCESNKISVSYKHTWVTFAISLIGTIVTFVAGYEYQWVHTNGHIAERKLSDFGRGVTQFFKYGYFHFNEWSAGATIFSWVLTIVILPILIGFVQVVDKCCNCCTCCPCCPTKCFPVVERIELDVDNMD